MPQLNQNTSNTKDLTQFELTKDTLTSLNKFEITPTAKLVLLYLTSCFNPNNKTVYPHIKTISTVLGISERSVNYAIQDLLKAGLILKTKSGTSNKYIFAMKILQVKNANSAPPNTQNLHLSCHEQIKHEQINEQRHVDVVSFNSVSNSAKPEPIEPKTTKTDNFDVIPQIILNNPTIRNAKAYWQSLSPEIKKEYIEKQKQAEEKEQREIEHQREVEKYKQEQAKIDRKIDEQMKKPLNERFTREQALKMVKNFRKNGLPFVAGMQADLIKAFEIKESELR